MYTFLNFVGIDFRPHTIDVTAMTHLHLDVYAPAGHVLQGEARRLQRATTATCTGSSELAFDAATTPAFVAGGWSSLEIPLADFRFSVPAGPSRTARAEHDRRASSCWWTISTCTGRIPARTDVSREGIGRMNNDNLYWKGLRRTDPDRPRPLADAVLRLIWQERRISRAGYRAAGRTCPAPRSRRSSTRSFPWASSPRCGEGPVAGRPPAHRAGIPGRRLRHPGRRDGRRPRGGRPDRPAGPRAGLGDARAPGPHRSGRDAPADRGAVPRHASAAPAAADRPLVGIGVAVPCPVDPSHPDRLSEIVLPAWEGRLGLDGPVAAVTTCR